MQPLPQVADLPRTHLDVQGVGHESGGAQGNHRYLTFCLTSTKFHADRFVSLDPRAIAFLLRG